MGYQEEVQITRELIAFIAKTPTKAAQKLKLRLMPQVILSLRQKPSNGHVAEIKKHESFERITGREHALHT